MQHEATASKSATQKKEADEENNATSKHLSTPSKNHRVEDEGDSSQFLAGFLAQSVVEQML